MNPTVFITGITRGIGLELTRQYLNLGWHVHGLLRKKEASPELKNLLQSRPSLLSLHHGDVSDPQTLLNLSQSLPNDSLQLLINNAGIYGPCGQTLNEVQLEDFMETFKINSLAPFMVSRSFFNKIRLGGCICNITSKMGSISDNTSGAAYAYRSSKAALNMISKSLSLDFKSKNITLVTVHPGWVKTDMGGPGALIDVEESVTGIRHLLEKVTLADTGKFFDYQGLEIPW